MNDAGQQHEPPKPDGQACLGEASVSQSASVSERLAIAAKDLRAFGMNGAAMACEYFAEMAKREGWTRTR